VRLKLDENLPDEAREAAAALGHDVDTVADEDLGGATDPEVLVAASREDRFVITLDRGFGTSAATRPAPTPASPYSGSTRRTRGLSPMR
jgi:predicted nuclease of predicted toxin-antitoxin system